MNDEVEQFCNVNRVDPSHVDGNVLQSLYALHSVEDVIRSTAIKDTSKLQLLETFKRARDNDCARGWLTQGTTKPLVRIHDNTYPYRACPMGHVFDACPSLFVRFVVGPNGEVCMTPKLVDVTL